MVDTLAVHGEGDGEGKGGGVRLEVSIGIAGFPDGGALSADQILATARDALREAREQVGRRVVVGVPGSAGK